MEVVQGGGGALFAAGVGYRADLRKEGSGWGNRAGNDGWGEKVYRGASVGLLESVFTFTTALGLGVLAGAAVLAVERGHTSAAK